MSTELDLCTKLSGTWYYAKDTEPDGRACFQFGDDGRYLEFALNSMNPEERWPQRYWYTQEGPDQIRLRPRPDHEGVTRHCEFRNGHLVLSCEWREWVCTRAEPHEIPEWFQHALANFKAASSARPFKWKR